MKTTDGKLQKNSAYQRMNCLNNVQKIVGQIAIILHGRHTTSQGHIQRKFGVAFLPRPEVKVKRYVFPK